MVRIQSQGKCEAHVLYREIIPVLVEFGSARKIRMIIIDDTTSPYLPERPFYDGADTNIIPPSVNEQ